MRSPLLVIGCLLICASLTYALDPRWAITQYGHDVWLRQNGLPASAVNYVYPSRSGYLWLATSAGLVRFDGANFKVIRISAKKEAIKEAVSVVLETDAGALWVGTQTNGLRLIERDQIREFGKKDGIDEEIRVLHSSADGQLWIGTANGLFVYAKNQFRRIPTASDYICGIVQDGARTIYVAHHAGVEIIHGEQRKLIGVAEGLPSPRVWSVSKDRKGTIWIGTDEGLCLWQNDKAVPVHFSNDPTIRIVNVVLEDRDGNLWVGTRNGGLFRFAQNQWSEISTSKGLSNNYVQALGEDREGSLWIATNEGLNRLRNINIVTYTNKEGLAHDSMWSLAESGDGTLYLFSDSAPYFSLLKNGVIKNVRGPGGPSFPARDGSLWVAGTGGLQHIQGEQITSYLPEMKGKWLSCVGEDDQSVLFFLDKLGLRRFINGKIEPYRLKDGTIYDNTDYHVVLKQDSRGTFWAGTINGLGRVQEGVHTKFTTRDGLADNWITSIDEAPDGTLWFSTMRGGITRYKDRKLTSYTTVQGLPDDQALCVLNDLAGNLWVSSPRGLFCISGKEIAELDAGKINQLHPRLFGTADGMKTDQCTFNASNSGWRRKDGTLWFTTKKGVVMVDPRIITTNTLSPPVLIEELIVDGKPSPQLSDLRLAPGTDKLEILYNGFSLHAPDRVLFKYKLEGYDQDWVEAGNRRVAYYTNLPPGSYKFLVMACNNDGLWSEAQTPLAFHVLPHFWQTWWFYGVVLCSLVGAAYAGLRWRVQQLKLRELELSERVQEQTQELHLEIAERKRAEDELQNAQQFLNNVINNVPSMIFVKDAQGRYKLANQACATLYGTTVENLLGKTDADFNQHSEEVQQIESADRQVLENLQEISIPEQQITDAAGNVHWLQTTKRPFLSSNGEERCLIGIATDFSERKLLESQLRHAQKLESIGQLAAGIAHEINTPTQYVGDNTRFVRDAFNDIQIILEKFTTLLASLKAGELKPDLISEVEEEMKTADIEYLREEVPTAIHQSLDGVSRIAKIVQSMKDFAHPGSSDKMSADLNKAIESTATVARNEWKYVADLELQLDKMLPLVPCYLSKFNQVILNMIINAAHAIGDVVGDGSQGKGKITITTKQINPDWVEVRIADTGKGIPTEIQSRIFDPFFTTKEVGKGTGQGLAISHTVIVEKHKGELSVESEVGKGATFIIRLPLGE